MNREANTRGANIEATRQAADWFVRISADDLSDQELAEWLQWCRITENATEFQRIRDISRGIESLRPEVSTILEALLAADSQKGVHADGRSRERPNERGRWMSSLIMATALGGVTVALSWFAVQSGWLAARVRVEAPEAELHSAVLPDGSKMILAPRTNLAFDFRGGTRQLELSKGEAFFTVRHDETRPFIVRIGSLTATALGTQFAVSSEPDHVIVTVQEGIVEVVGSGSPEAKDRRWRLTAGFQGRFDSTNHAATISSVDAATALAWREGRLNYSDEQLRVVVADVNRYTTRTLEIRDSKVGDLRFTGTIFTRQIDDWLTAIQSTFPVRVVNQDPNHSVLTAASVDAAADESSR